MGITICADGTDRKNLQALVDNGAQLIYGPHANTTGGTTAGWYKFRAAWGGPERLDRTDEGARRAAQPRRACTTPTSSRPLPRTRAPAGPAAPGSSALTARRWPRCRRPRQKRQQGVYPDPQRSDSGQKIAEPESPARVLMSLAGALGPVAVRPSNYSYFVPKYPRPPWPAPHWPERRRVQGPEVGG